MPCKKCENEKWKWGENGECQYDSKEACEKANKDKKGYKSVKKEYSYVSPLGKKTYAEYNNEKLQGINLSAEKINLASVSQLDKWEDQSYDIYDAMPETNDIEMAFVDVENYRGDIRFAEEKMADAQEEVNESTKILAEEQEKMDEAKKEVDFWKGEVKNHQNEVKERKAEVKEFSGLLKKAEKEYATISKSAKTTQGKAQKLLSTFQKGLSEFEKSAKALGLDVSNKVSDYNAAIANLKEVTAVKLD
jgi:chromosome segregation ATPase